jgi:hypothetical protein
MTDRTLLQQALDALESVNAAMPFPVAEAIISTLRQRLAQPEPEGWKWVPVEPSQEMLDAADEGDREYTLRNFGDIQTVMQGPHDHWCAMLAAAPQKDPL